MPSITIDAGVLAIPSENSPFEDVHRYVETLLEWKNLIDEHWVTIYMSENASAALIDDEVFPFHNRLASLFFEKGVIAFDANTVTPVITRLLQLTPSFEEYFSIRDVLYQSRLIMPQC